MKQTLSAIFLFIISLSFAQQKNLGNIKNVNPSSLNIIQDRGEIQGYYIYYILDKVDRKNNLYQLEILDNNLQTTHKVEFTRPKATYFLGGSFNGETFCFGFASNQFKTIEYEIYDKQANKQSTYKVGKDGEGEISNLEVKPNSKGGQTYTSSLTAVPNNGYLRTYATGKKRNRAYLELFDNSGKKKWTFDMGQIETKIFETMTVSYVNEKYVVVDYTSRKKQLSTKGMESIKFILDVNTGKKVGSYKVTNDKYSLSQYGTDYDAKNDQIYFYGEHFGLKANGKINIKEKLGFFAFAIEPSGKLISQKYVTYKEDVAKKIPLEERKKILDKRSIFIHKLVFLDNGKIYAIGEQYNKVVSASGTALKVLGGLAGAATAGSNVQVSGQASAFEIHLHDMMVFEMSSSMALEKVHIIPKKRVTVGIPNGSGLSGEARLGYYINSLGLFEYSYTTIAPDRKSFNSVYINFNRKIKKKKENTSKYVVGYIGLDEDADLSSGTFKINGRPTWYRAIPAKTGYHSIFEYYKKEKKATARLEKLDL